MKENKIKTSFTISKKVKRLIGILAKKLEISKTSVIQVAVIRLAESEGLVLEEE